jgi:hypothetical protein
MTFANQYEPYFKIYEKHFAFDVNIARNYDQDHLHNLLVLLAKETDEVDKMDVKNTL